MKNYLLYLLFFYFAVTSTFAQTPSPDEFLGYPLGSKFTPHQKVVDYFKKVAATNKNIKLEVYGKTYEGRELVLAAVSDQTNIDNLEDIRTNNLKLANADKTTTIKQPAILWLSYNVHGNEANSTETAMKVLYTLVLAKEKQTKDWLKNTVVIIDPSLNPDGRERYVNYFSSVSGAEPDADPSAREHNEPWPGGRTNHYYFDLNRDWAWQTQIETQARLTAYHKWMPQVHVDFHEQNYNDPYYFAPAAEPIHQDITSWQKEFQVIVGKNNAKYFDENGWKYFTKERFDLLYPSYGDTYPLYNGAIGMTYEQGGIRAGLAVVTNDGDTLTLKDRIDHHFTTSLATLETVSTNAEKLVAEFKKYFENSVANPPGIYKTYIVKAQNISRLRKLSTLLKRNNISFAFGGDKTLNGYNYETQKTESFKIERNDLIVNLQQPHAVMANVLFEPQTLVTDSNTYDITAWALPYAYGLKAYAVKENVKGNFSSIEYKKQDVPVIAKPYAWVFPWNSITDAQILAKLQQHKLKIRVADESFGIGNKIYPAGSLLVYRAENEKTIKNLQQTLNDLTKNSEAVFYPIASGFVDKGKDFGSSTYRLLSAPKIGVLAGNEVSSQSLGEIWHFFEQELNYPLHIISVQSAAYLDISKINTLIIPDGSYNDKLADQLTGWLNAGGKLILMEDAISAFLEKKSFEIKKIAKTVEKEEKSDLKYVDRNKDDFENSIPGAIYKVTLDNGHPLSFNLGSFYYTLKTDDKVYDVLEKGWNVGTIKPNSYVAGLAGSKIKKTLTKGLLYGVQKFGKGSVIYLSTDVLFRSFWENGKQLFINALFLIN